MRLLQKSGGGGGGGGDHSFPIFYDQDASLEIFIKLKIHFTVADAACNKEVLLQ